MNEPYGFVLQTKKVFYIKNTRKSNRILSISSTEKHTRSVMDDDGASQYPSSSNINDVGDFNDLVIEN